MPKSRNRKKSRLALPRDSTLHRRRYFGSRHPKISRRSIQKRCKSRGMTLSKKGKYCIKRTRKNSKKNHKSLISCYKTFKKRGLAGTESCSICTEAVRVSYYCRGCKCDKNDVFFHKKCLAKSLEAMSKTVCPFCRNECCN